MKSIFKFLSSLKLAVFSLLLLSAVLAVATVVGSYYGMRGSQIAVYQRWWFAGVLFLLGLNVFCAAMSRYPWKLRQSGFVITHLGIIVILVGAFVTQRFGIDGNMPIPENTQSSEVILNDLKLTLIDQKNGTQKVINIPESYVTKEGKLLEVLFNQSEKLTLEKFIPRAIPEMKLVPSSLPGLGIPAVRIGLKNDRFQMDEWLKVDPKQKKAELNLGPALVSFEKLTTLNDEKAFFSRGGVEKYASKQKVEMGKLLLDRNGQKVAVSVADALGKWRSLESLGIDVQVKQYLPYAVVENKKLITKNQEPVNPAIEVLVRSSSQSKEVQKHTLFALFPEFNTVHKKDQKANQSDLEVDLSYVGPQTNQNLMGVGKSRGRLFLAQSEDNTKLLYRVLASSGKVNSEGELKVGSPISTGWMDIQLELKEWLPSAVVEEEPRSVEVLQGADEPFLTAVRLKVGNSPSFWLVEGMGKNLSIGGTDFTLHYHRARLNLPFKIYLNKFTMGTNPGTNTAATFVSNVTVKDPKAQEDKRAEISMNEPLKYGGYYFYQASYQLSPGQPAVSVFAVNHDPGRILKYLGSLLMTIGIGLMFYMNPQYLKVFFGGHKEAT